MDIIFSAFITMLLIVYLSCINKGKYGLATVLAAIAFIFVIVMGGLYGN